MADDPKTGGDGGIKAAIREVLAELGIAGKKEAGAGGDGPPADLTSQVADAVRQVREGDAAARAREKTEARLAALEAKKETPEKERAPKERRRIERFMGWVTDDE